VGIKVDAGEGLVRDLAASTLLVVGDRLWSYVRIALFGLLILWFTSILAFPVSKVDDENVPSWVRVGVLTLFVMILAILVNYMARPTTRTKALQYLMRGGDYGWLSPLLWAAAIFFFTTIIFSAVTQLLWEWRVVDISDPSCTTPCALIPDNFFNFYTWHFLESIPLFKVNETLQLKEPLVYRGAAAGWLVVAFKVAVILPLIQAVRSYWKLRSDLPSLRIDAWPRIVHEGEKVTIKWTPSEPPVGYVFDVYIEEPSIGQREAEAASTNEDLSREQAATNLLVGAGWKLWLEGETKTSADYSAPRAGSYRFQARWRKTAENRAQASSTPRTVRIIVKQVHSNKGRVNSSQ
jgi:uncharacterized membrane protein